MVAVAVATVVVKGSRAEQYCVAMTEYRWSMKHRSRLSCEQPLRPCSSSGDATTVAA